MSGRPVVAAILLLLSLPFIALLAMDNLDLALHALIVLAGVALLIFRPDLWLTVVVLVVVAFLLLVGETTETTIAIVVGVIALGVCALTKCANVQEAIGTVLKKLRE